MNRYLSIPLLCLVAACTSQPEKTQKSISDYVLQCRNITDNSEYPLGCDVTRINDYVLLRVIFPDTETYSEWQHQVAKEISGPFCHTVANELRRASAIQYIVRGDDSDDLAHNLLDCETLEESGWQKIDLYKKPDTVLF